MEKEGKYIESYKLEQYLKEYFEENQRMTDIFSALDHFLKTKQYHEYNSPFETDEDIILMEDALFLQRLKCIPVNLEYSNPVETCLSDKYFIPLNYDCYTTTNFNYQASVEHAHDFFEICYVWQGYCLQTINGVEHEVRAGDFFFIPPNTAHIVNVPDKTSIIINILICKTAFETSFFSIMSKNTVLSSFFRNVLYGNQEPNYMMIHTDNNFPVRRIIKHLVFDCYLRTYAFNNAATGIVINLFSYLLQSGTPEIEISNKWYTKNNKILEILNYIQQNYITVTLSQLSEIFHFSEPHLSRLIKGTSGETFSMHIREIRLQKAKELLSRTNLPIERICKLIGYNDITHFNRIVKKATGVTPYIYRKNYREGNPVEH